MKTAALLLLAAAALYSAPKVSPGLVTSMSQRLDSRLIRLSTDDPVMPIGLTQGAYIPGYGAVFMGSLNLAPMAGITPFHQTVSKEEIARIHDKKVKRVPKLKELMQQMLVNLASSMDPVPEQEQIALAVSLFYFNGEDTGGLPMQIVMHAQRKALLGGPSAIRTEEF